jgi:non-lysosomal glucosylceramidase
MLKSPFTLLAFVLWASLVHFATAADQCCNGKSCCQGGTCPTSMEEAQSAEDAGKAYANMIEAESGLIGYWPLREDVNDDNDRLNGEAKGGTPVFVDRPGGKALSLEKSRFVTFGDAPEIDVPRTTVELLFKPDFAVNPGYNPTLVAKRSVGDHSLTRFSIHVLGDYSGIIVWNGRQGAIFKAEEGEMQKGMWHHLAVTNKGSDTVLYLNGVPCRCDQTKYAFSRRENRRPLSFGSATPEGQELFSGEMAEVAIYDRVLAPEEVARHVDANGWKQRRERLVIVAREREEREKRAREEADAKRNQRREQLFNDPALFAKGEPTVFRGEHLQTISLPLGGIGSGCIQINGMADMNVWQIFNNRNGEKLPNSFFAVRAKTEKGEPVVRALQGTAVGPFKAMKDLSFRGAYPFGWYDFEDAELPAKISLEVFNPLIPLDAKNSAIPCVIFNVTAQNPSDKPLEVSFLASQQNAVGYLGDKPVKDRSYPGYGKNANEAVLEKDGCLLHMSADQPKDSRGFGDMALATLSEGASVATSWTDLDRLAGRFKTEGAMTSPDKAGPSPAGETIDGAIAVRFTLAPGEKKTVPFVLTWYFPNTAHGDGAWGGTGNMYANWWPDALAVAKYVKENLPELTRKTRLYHDTLFQSNLPCWMLERLSSQIAILRSPTCFWNKDNYFGGWEGSCSGHGCCMGNCNHVWQYAQSHGRLFPEIGRLMREQEFRFEGPDGTVPHRQPKEMVAFDGQCGTVLNSYREHLMSPDGKWLAANWPKIKLAMDYLVAHWDKDEDGVLAGPQWNTLDCYTGGSTSWLGTMYLAALAAGEKMAILQNEPETAKRWEKIRLSGMKKQDETLFNGEYYIQIPDPKPVNDYGTGCHIDQLLGQWWAWQLNLGDLYPRNHLETTLKSLMKYNFRGNFEGVPQFPRKYISDEDPALEMTTWPKGDVPDPFINYANEAWTGCEYPAAAEMIEAGLVREGFAVARAVWLRYDGRNRKGLTTDGWGAKAFNSNPFGDDECGSFYARAMSNYSMLIACQGYVYDGPAGVIGFKPKYQPENHASFFTAAEGWGLFRQGRTGDKQLEQIAVAYGSLRVQTLIFELPEGAKATAAGAGLAPEVLPSKFVQNGRELRITLDEPVVVKAGQHLSIEIATGK